MSRLAIYFELILFNDFSDRQFVTQLIFGNYLFYISIRGLNFLK